MFKQIFASMNELLDQIVQHYPTADGTRRNDLKEQIKVLQSMSSLCITEWLRFEEKMSGYLESAALPAIPHPDAPEPSSAADGPVSAEEVPDAFSKGQGYFELTMYRKAIEEFEKVIFQRPDFLLARLYLALGYLEIGEDSEAQRHFQLILPFTRHQQMLAIVYSALGCIQAKNNNLDKANDFFDMACKMDPGIMDFR